MEDIDKLLQGYEPGLPKNKPEVLKQTQDIKEKREKMKEDYAEQMKNELTGICMDVSGQKQKNLTKIEVVQVIQQQQQQIASMKQHIEKNPTVTMQQSDGSVATLNTQQMLQIIQQHQQRGAQLNTELEKMKKENADMKSLIEKLESNNKELVTDKDSLKKKCDDNNGISKTAFLEMEEKYNTLCIQHKELELKCLKLEAGDKIVNPQIVPSVNVKVDENA